MALEQFESMYPSPSVLLGICEDIPSANPLLSSQLYDLIFKAFFNIRSPKYQLHGMLSFSMFQVNLLKERNSENGQYARLLFEKEDNLSFKGFIKACGGKYSTLRVKILT